MRYKNRYNTNNVNICVNVSNNTINGGTGSGTGTGSSSDIILLQNKVNLIASDLDTLKTNFNNLSSNEYFELKLHQYLSASDIERIKNIVESSNYQTIQNYISRYDEINEILNNNANVDYKETEVYFVEYAEDASTVIKAEVDGEWYYLNDTTNSDNDEDTIYKFPVKGFVIGIEIYSNSTGDAREAFTGIKTSYNSENDETTVFMNKGDYNFIYERRPNNKIRLYSLLIK